MDEKLNLLLLLADSTYPMHLILNKIRSHQIHKLNKGRKSFGEYHHLFPILKKYPAKFKQYVRMKVDTFLYILSKVEDLLVKNWCNFHTQPIFAEERLVLTLRFLATGSTYSQLSLTFRMGISTVSTIIEETMDILWKVLQPIHMPIPTTNNFLAISEKFYMKWNFPNCLGAIDGRHIRIQKPAHSGSLYFNYKKFFSVVLQAVVDAEYKYILIDVGGYGRQSDEGTFKASELYKALEQKKLQIPNESELLNSTTVLPHCFIGDGAYPLMENIMKPYPGNNLAHNQKIFNKRLSRARAVLENAFGFTCQKWRIFYTTINKHPDVVNAIVKCTCILHNVIIDLEPENCPDSIQLTKGSADDNLSFTSEKNDFVIGLGKEVRQELTKYFVKNPLGNIEG